MTEEVRYRIDRELVENAAKVCHEIGMTPTQAVSIFFAQLIKVRGLPFRPSEFPVLDEYGVTQTEAEQAIAKAKKKIAKDRKSGRMVDFKGKIPLSVCRGTIRKSSCG